MEELQNIQWFPGHMTKTLRKMSESIKLIDIVAEIVDARIPQSSRNPNLDSLISGKPRIILLNKSDISDETETKRWIEYYKKSGVPALSIDSKSGRGLKGFVPLVRQTLKPLIERWESKGMIGHSIKIMVAGIPNVGKSSFINKMAGNTKARVEDRPGVTRGNQWYTVEKGVDLLDTPGILWPKFDDPSVAERLAFTGAVKDQVVDIEALAMRFLLFMNEHYHYRLNERYKIGDTGGFGGFELLELVGMKRGMLISGGDIDVERAAVTVLDEYRSGKLGNMTLEIAP